jgi:hypothetical protein
MPSPETVTKLPDDAFRAQLRAVVARIRTWVASIDDVARIEMSEADAYWRLRAEPEAEHACPFELIVHADQHFDLTVGPETYEERSIGDVQLIAQLAEAIGDGHVITRTLASRNTDAVRSVETLVPLEGGAEWRGKRLNEPMASAIRAEDCEARDQHYVPYRRTSIKPDVSRSSVARA